MFVQRANDDSMLSLLEEWERNKLARNTQTNSRRDLYTPFSMLSEWKDEGPRTLHEVYEKCVSIGQFDASLAWIVGVSNSAWSMLGNASEQTVQSINYPIVSMVLGRPGQAFIDDEQNTATIKGEWRYCSGYEQSGGFIGLVKDMSSNGEVYVCLMPSSELEIVDTWDAIGLKDTGSHTVRASSLVVDKNLLIPYSSVLKSQAHGDGAVSYKHLFTGVLMNCLTGSIVGATIHMFELAQKQLISNPIGGSSYTLGSDSGAMRSSIGKIASQLQQIYEFGAGGAKFVDTVAAGDQKEWTTENRALLRSRASSVMKQCRQVADELAWMMGSSVMTEHSPVAKIWKDIHVGALHGGFSKYIPEEAAGLSLLGEDPFTLTKML